MTRPRQSSLVSGIVRWSALLALAPALGGCVAAVVAVPAMTAAGVLSERKKADDTPSAEPVVEVRSTAVVPPTIAAGDEQVRLTPLTELPAPTGGSGTSSGAASWRAFTGFAREGAATLAAGGELDSALLAPGGAISFTARKRACADREPAVIVDLDPEGTAFDPAEAARVSPVVAEGLSGLREAEVVVLWISRRHANDIDHVADALRTSGLDPTGRDPILLVRNADERKQVLREQAGASVCVIAIAGDERADFDELFDYLRDPATAGLYDSLIGSGWFIVPSPLEEPPAIEVPNLPAAPPEIVVPDVSGVPPAGEDGGR